MNREQENNWLWLVIGLLTASSIVSNILQLHISAEHLQDRAKLSQQVQSLQKLIEEGCHEHR